MNASVQLRVKPRLNIVRGHPGNETSAFTHNATPKAGEGILSGMVISLDSNGEWVKGAPAGKIAHFAYHDQSDTDVRASGKLLGLSCLGNFRLETAFVDGTATYAASSPLKANTAGNVGDVTLGVLNNTADIIGFATAARQDVSAVNSQAVAPIYTLTLDTKWIPLHA